MTPEISQALAVYRRQRVKPMGGSARGGNSAGPDLAKIEQEAFEGEQKRQEQQAKMQAAEQEASNKAALKAQNDAAEARYRAESRPFYTNASGQILPSESDEQHAAKTQHKAVNDTKASEYFQMNRPFRRDMQGNVVPRQTDEEWQAQKATKQAALEAAKIDKANKAHRDEVRSGIDQQQAVLSSNDDLVQRRTQELQLTAENARAEVTKRKRFIEDAKKRLDAMDPADTQFETVSAAMEKMQAEIEQHQAAADAADDESRRQQAGTLAWQKEQDVLKGRLRQEEAGVDALVAPQNAGPATGITTPGTPKVRAEAPSTPGVRSQVLAARVDALAKNPDLPDAERKIALTKLQLRAKDPAAYETAMRLEMEQADVPTLSATLEKDAAEHEQRVAALNAKVDALKQERDALTQRVDAAFQRAQQRLNAPHTAGELVTVPSPDGESQVSMPRDVAEGYMEELARLKQWQDSKQAEADLIEIEGQEANLDARVINEGQKVLNAKQQAAHQRSVQENEQALAELRSNPETRAYGDALHTAREDARTRSQVVMEMYPEDGPERQAALRAIDNEVQTKATAVRDQMQQAEQAKATRTQDAATRIYGDLARKLQTAEVDKLAGTDGWQNVENAAYVEALDALTKELGGSDVVKSGTMGVPKASPERQKAVQILRDFRALDWSHGDTEAPVRYLSDGQPVINPELYLDRKGFEEAVQKADATPEQKAKLMAEHPKLEAEAAKAQLAELSTLGVFQSWEAGQPAGLSDVEKLRRFQEENSGVLNTGAWKVRMTQALLGVAQGVLGLGQIVAGTAMAVTRSERAEKAFKALSTDSASIGAASQALPTGQWVNMGTSMIVSTIPSLAGGSLKAASALAGMQTFGQMYGNAVEGYQKQGSSRSEALTKAWMPAAASGLATLLLTRAGGEKGVEALLRKGTLKADVKQWVKAVSGGALQEGWLEEAPDQLIQGMIERHTFNPEKSWAQIAEETLEAGIGGTLMGGMFEAMNTRFERGAQTDTPGDKAAPSMPVSPAATGTPQNDISTGPRESELSKPDMGSAVPVVSMGKPEMAAAARASIDAFSEAGMKPHQVEDTKAKAGVVMDIAQGAKLADLTDEQLRLVGLNRDGTPGHYQNEPVDKKDPSKGSTRVWKKGPRADGFQPVVVEDGKLIITQRQIDNLKKKLPAVAQAIGLSEVERRKQIQNPAPAPAEAGTTNDETRIAPETAPATGADAAQGRAQEIAVAGDATARSGQALESPAPAELTAQAADDIPMAWDQSGERTDMVPEAQQAAVHPVLASAGFDAPSLERAGLIAGHLQDAGLSADEAAVAAGSVVRSMGVVGEDYTAQMVEDGFTQAMKAAGFQRRANMPTKWERKPSTERGEMTKATVIKADRSGRAPVQKRIPLIERADFKQAADKAMMGVFERLRGAPDKQKAQAEVKLLTNARNALVDLVDTQYGAFFDDVVVNSHGNGGGIQARATAFDPKTGRATAVVIEIDPDTFLNHGSRSREGIERVLNEEFSHRIDLMVSSEREAIDLAKSVHKARPGVFNAAWKQYFSVEITRGDLPAKPPAELTDRQAYQLYFEATRLIHQGTFTTENAEMPDIPLMRKIYLYLTRLVQTVQREMRKLPESVRSEWQWRIDQAESMMRKLQKAAIAAEKAALDDVEPPESAVKKAKPPAKTSRGSDPDLDADLEAAWESEQRSRRARPVFTPTQQALRNLRGLKDPDNDQINILSRISLEGGIAIYSEKVRKMRRQQDLPIGGELDWLEQANLTPFWKGVIFRKGNAQNVDKIIGQLFEEGYFPQAAEQADVTGEMLAAKLEDVLSRYAAMKAGEGDLADADEQTGNEMSRLEAQRVAFDRATESGPIEVQAAELRVGDRMQVKGADGKLHPVEVIAVDIQPLPNGETFDPEGNPSHFYDANGRAVMLASVTLKDGTTFGVQQIDGEAGLFVDEFKVQQDYDWYASLRDAVLTGKLDEAEGLLHFMEHEGMGANAAWSDILTALQSKLRLPMKKAQKMLAAVFDTTPKASDPAELDTDNPLGSARKRDAGPSMFGEAFDLLSGDKGTKGLFEAPSFKSQVSSSLPAEPMAAITQPLPNVVDRPNHTIPRYWRDDQGNVRKAKKVFRVIPGRGTNELNWLQRPTDTVVFSGTDAEARQWAQQQGGIFMEPEAPVAQVAPSPAFSLESPTGLALDAEARRKELREKLQARQDKPLIGTLGDIGQGQLFGGGDLFAPPAPKAEPRQEVKASSSQESPPPAPEPRLGDFGEKIGGARKDNAAKGEKTPKSATPAAESQDPGWRKRYDAVEIVSGKDKGRWALIDLRKKDWTGAPEHATRTTFASEAEARQHIPLIAVARNHGVYSVGSAEGGAPSSEALKKSIENQMKQINALKMGNERLLLATGITERFKKALADGQLTAEKYAAHVREGTILSDVDYSQGKAIQDQIRTLQNTPTPEMVAADAAKRYAIFRNVTDRKRVRVVDDTFNSYEDGMRYLAKHAEQIIETKTSFGEEILAKPENAVRVGPERRPRPADAALFQEAFGFRGVEFGNWMRDGGTESERQEVLNHAYDGLMDLAETLNIPPRAISLNGELSLAFGARGHGLTGAKAHYERDYAVINLTKMSGAGSLAHEWFHALDHYLGRQDGKAARERKLNEQGNMAFPMKGREGDYVSHGFGYKSDVREELRARYKELIERMFTKAEQFVEDTEKAEKFVAAARQWVVDQLAAIRKDLADAKDPTYYKRNNKPATQEQLDAFDTHSARILEGEALATEWRYNQSGDKPASARGAMTGRWSNDTLDAMNEIVKGVRGRSGFNKEGHGALDQLRGVMKRYAERLKMLADATAQTTKSKMVPTSYAMDAKRIDQGRASEYWATPHEMAARAFSGYVEDKLQEQGRASEFLAYGADNNLPQYRIFRVRPFPAGDERKLINGLFDAFFGELKVKETEKGLMLHSARKRGELTETSIFQQRLATAKAEIEADMADGTVPATVRSWQDLQDHVDANEYVNDKERPDRVIGVFGKAQGWKSQDYVTFTNRLIEAVDAWLAGGRVADARVAEEPFKLDNGAIQGYFELPDVQVPASKQEAAREAIQNGLQAVSVSAAKGADRDAARRTQARRAYGGLIARDVDAIREGLAQGKGRISVLMHEFIRHEIPGFNIRGAVIEKPEDFAAFNLAVRSPFFESVKIAVLGDGQQVIHSQMLHVGALNQSIFSTRMIAAVIGEARRANPKQEISGIVIGHNHPSGDPSPSDADKRVTRMLEDTMEVLGVPLTDHVITNGEKYFSFREMGSLRNGAGWNKRKPKLPVLPKPEQSVVGWGNPATGNMADWEAGATSQRPEMGAPEKAKPYLEALATADPGHMHALYLDTRMQLLAVERLDRNANVARVVIESAAREGAYGVMLSQPNQSADPAPSDAFRRLVRRVGEAVRSADIKLLDAIVGSTNGQQFSFAMQGLIGETAATYTVDAAAHEAATSPLNDLPEPTEAQREAGNYAKGHVRIAGHEISIENPAGSKRRPEWPALKDHYGYIRSVRVPKNGFPQSAVADSEAASDGAKAFPRFQPGVDAGKVVTDLVAAVSNIDLPSAENAAQSILVDPKSSGYLSARNAFANELLRRLEIPRDGSRKGIESQFVEATRDGLAADSKLFGDGVQGMLLRTQGFDALDIQGKAMVERHVRSTIQNPQVLRAIVQLVPVDVVNMLGGRKIFGTNDDAVLLQRFTAALDDPVMIGRLIDGVAASLPAALALRIAERVGQSVKTPLAAMQNGPTTGTGNGGHESSSTRVSPKGKDGDHVDVFIKPGTPTDFAGDVYVVRQITPATGRFDEWKVMMGYDSITEAEQAYRRNYTPGWKGLDSIVAQSMDDFTKHLAMGAFAQAKTGDTALASAAKRGTVAKVAGFVGETVPLAILRGRGASATIGALTGGAIGALTAGPVGAMYGAAAGAALYGSHAVEKAGLQPMLAKLGSNNLDKFISNVVFGKVAKWAKVENGKQAVEVWLGKPGLLSKIAKGALDQTVPLWNVPREWLAAYHESQRKAAWGREKAMDVIRALSHNAKVSDLAYPKEFVEDPAWRVKLFDAMEGKADMTTLPQPLQDLAERLRKLLKETGQELVRQGIMSLDTFEELSATGWMPRYTEEEAEAAGGSWLKAFKLGVKDLVAQRSTAWHVVDTTRKEKDGQYAIVSRDEGGKRNRWRFRNEQHRNAWYEDFIKGEAVKMLTTGGKDVTSLLAALTPDATRAVREEIWNLTREKIDRPAELSENLRNVVKRAVELQRFRYKKESPFEPDKLIKDPVYAVARYVMGATHNAATMELLKVTAKKAEWVSDVSLDGFKQMPDNDRFGPLAGKHVRDEIATQVLDLVDMPGTILGAYDSILRTWKAGKLVLNPGSHIRDAVGNVAFSVLAGSNPMNPGNLPYYRDAIAALRDGGDTYAELIEMQVLGGDAFTTEVKTALKGLLPDTKTVEGKDAKWIMRQIMGVGTVVRTAVGAGVGGLIGGPVGAVAGAALAVSPAKTRGGYEYLAALRQVPDNLYKTAAYLKYKAAGMSPAEAAAEVRKWFPYYDRLGSSGLIKKGSRFVMPFSSFFRESTRILGRGAVERPLAMASILGLASGITQLSLMMLGLGDEDEESVFRSMRGKLKLGLSGDAPVFSMLLPMRTDEGQLQQWDISSVLPFADLLGTRVEMRQGEDEWTKFWRGSFTQSPILSTTWAWSTNTDAFSGRKIVEDDMGMLESTKERVRELGDTMLPPLTPWFGVHANTLNNAGRRMSTLETRNATQSYLRALVGLDVRSADPNLRTETEFFRKEKKLPLANDGSLYATPLKSRLGREIKSELIQDAPDIDAVADAMLRLEESGNPIKTREDMEKLLKGLDPDRLIKEEYRRKLIQSFSPEALRVWRTQQSEFSAAQRRLPSVMSQVSPLVKARRARVSTPVMP